MYLAHAAAGLYAKSVEQLSVEVMSQNHKPSGRPLSKQ